MLINHYSGKKCFLYWHQDNEKSLDPGSSVSTLSLGSTRRLLVAPPTEKGTKYKTEHTATLCPNSVFVMKPGFQQEFFHELAAGSKSKSERGLRFSITFRNVISARENPLTASPNPQIQSTSTAVPDPPIQNTSPLSGSSSVHTPTKCIDTVVFGTSLVKGMDESLLSKHNYTGGSTFKVFSNPGAKLPAIFDNVIKVRDSGNIDCSKVGKIFLVCGGNDVENLSKKSGISSVFYDFEDLIDLTKETFPNAKINLVSLIPRRSRYKQHINNMLHVNDWLFDFCAEENIRFVDIWSFFLEKKSGRFTGKMNKKLFNWGMLHFSKVGECVLAKVLIAVSNRPRAQ